jgi:hypothetical protein
MDMILTHRSFENLDVLGIANLDDQFSTPFLNLAFQHVVAVFSYPHDMNCQSGYRVATFSLFCHDVLRQSYHPWVVSDTAQKCVAAKASH